jgi:hypothetical protein
VDHRLKDNVKRYTKRSKLEAFLNWLADVSNFVCD